MSTHNPAGTDGFDFLEFTTRDPQKLIQQFESMGFIPVARHKSSDVTMYQQNDIRFIINATQHSEASRFAELHGSSVSAMGFRVKDAGQAHQYAIAMGARDYQPNEKHIYHLPAIYGVGESLIYFIDYQGNIPNYAADFSYFPDSSSAHANAELGLSYIDHVTHNLHRGNMDKWADFYTRLFNFREIRYFDIEGKLTGLKSRAMTSPCGKIRIPLNESSDDKSQIEEFLKDFKGEG